MARWMDKSTLELAHPNPMTSQILNVNRDINPEVEIVPGFQIYRFQNVPANCVIRLKIYPTN